MVGGTRAASVLRMIPAFSPIFLLGFGFVACGEVLNTASYAAGMQLKAFAQQAEAPSISHLATISAGAPSQETPIFSEFLTVTVKPISSRRGAVTSQPSMPAAAAERAVMDEAPLAAGSRALSTPEAVDKAKVAFSPDVAVGTKVREANPVETLPVQAAVAHESHAKLADGAGAPSVSEAIRQDITKAVMDAVAARLASYRANGFNMTASAAPVAKQQVPAPGTPPAPVETPSTMGNTYGNSTEIAGSFAVAVSIFGPATATATSD